jgi:hypothetical protein
MSKRHCLLSLAILTLCSHPALLGAVVGGTAGLVVTKVFVGSNSSCGILDKDLGSCVGERVALVLGATGAGAPVGAVIAGESSTWVPARGRPANEATGPTVGPFLTWHDGPAVGLRVRFR